MSRRVRLVLLASAGLLGLALLGVGYALRGGSSDDARITAADEFNPHPIAGAFAPDDRVLSSCGADRKCQEQAFGNLAYSEGPEAALRIFDARILSDSEIEANCHRIAHMIGSAALAHFDGNVSRAFTAGSASCNSGYYHGLLERALVGIRTKDGLVRTAREICADEEVRASTFIAYQCVHGLGHGLMIYTGLNLPFSLTICERLQSAWDQNSCDGGVFMENFSSSYGTKSKFLRDDDPIYPCQAVAEKHKLYCFLQVTARLLQTSGYDWAKTADACAKVEANWRATCFQSYGRDASGVARLDAKELIRLCNVPAPRWRADCVYGAVRDIVNMDAEPLRGTRFCELVAIRLRGRCFYGVGSIMSVLTRTKEEHHAACAEITSRYAAECRLESSG